MPSRIGTAAVRRPDAGDRVFDPVALPATAGTLTGTTVGGATLGGGPGGPGNGTDAQNPFNGSYNLSGGSSP